jgi:hypothetical protein
MSPSRTQRVLIGLLLAQLALLLLIRHPFGAGHAPEEHALLPMLASMTLSKLEITDGNGATVTLEKSGGAWTLDQPKGYPVEAGRVEKLIQSLEHLNVTRPMVSSPAHHAALRVADSEFERRVRLWSGSGTRPALVVYVGKSSSPGATAVRTGGRNEVYEVSDLNSYDLPGHANEWIERTLLPTRAEQVQRLDLTNGKGSFSVEKRDGRWRVAAPASQAAAAVDSTQVLSLLRSLCGLWVDEPVGPPDESAEGLTRPDASLRLTQAAAGGDQAGTTVTLKIGAADPEHGGDRFAVRSGFGFAVRVTSSSAQRALDATLSDVLAK